MSDEDDTSKSDFSYICLNIFCACMVLVAGAGFVGVVILLWKTILR
jgi:hypothetical protein